MAESIPTITLPDVSRIGPPPITRIKSDEDVELWKSKRSYQDYRIFLRRLNESVVGCTLPWEPEKRSQAVEKMLVLLNTLDAWIEEIPPLNTPQRFGNLAFRTWGQRLEESADRLLGDLLGSANLGFVPFVKPYFLTSFGHSVRLDYVRFFERNVDEERDLVLTIFLRYLKLCWRLQDDYKLEPAGSHGVWGLDDYCFLPYIFGSGQLREDQTSIPVSAVLHPPLPSTNLYFLAIMRIHQVKYGPFHEHSSQLHSIATGVPHWGKVNSGLFKMYEGEVLGKRVVVQHIPLGGLLEWDPCNCEETTTSERTASQDSMVMCSAKAVAQKMPNRCNT